MGVASSPGAGRPRRARRSIRFTFTVMVTVPVICLVAGWIVALLLTPGGALTRHALFWQNHRDLGQVALYAGGGIVIVLIAVVLMASFATRISRDVSGLEATARHLADEQLPQMMRDLRSGGSEPGRAPGSPAAAEDADRDTTFTPPRPRTREIARTAAALTGLQQAALAAAGDEANLRNGVAQVFVSLARRNQSLLQRQLRLIDTLEQKAADPAALADLFLLDHLTTRMRRHAENLIILSGSSPGRSWSDPVPVIDVIRGAVGEVEDYQRVRVITRSQDAVTGSAVADMIHLLAELIENAAMFSPSGTRVEVRAERVANGFVVEVEDRGLGVQPDLLTGINQQLSSPPDFALADPDRLGLFVVGRLAARHGVRVSLSPSPYGGTKAVALIPHNLVLTGAEPGLTGRETPPAIDGPTPLDRRPGEALVLTGRRADPPSPVIEAGGPPDVLFSSSAPLPTAGASPFGLADTGTHDADSFVTTPGSTDSGSTAPFPAVREPDWAEAPSITPAQPAGGEADRTPAIWPGSVPSQFDRDSTDRDSADRDSADPVRAERDRADSLSRIPSQLDRDGAESQDSDLPSWHDAGNGPIAGSDRYAGSDTSSPGGTPSHSDIADPGDIADAGDAGRPGDAGGFGDIAGAGDVAGREDGGEPGDGSDGPAAPKRAKPKPVEPIPMGPVGSATAGGLGRGAIRPAVPLDPVGSDSADGSGSLAGPGEALESGSADVAGRTFGRSGFLTPGEADDLDSGRAPDESGETGQPDAGRSGAWTDTTGSEAKPGGFGSGLLGRRPGRLGAREPAAPGAGSAEPGAAAFGLPRRRSMRPGSASAGGPQQSMPAARTTEPGKEPPGFSAGPPWPDMPGRMPEPGAGFGLRTAWSGTPEGEGSGPDLAGPGAPGSQPPGSGFGAEARGAGGVLPARSSGTYRGLPRRVRQASLPSQLRDAPAMDAQARAAGPGPGLNADRSPEQARNVVASFRAAYQRELGDDAPQAADAEHTQTQNPQAQPTQVPGAQGSGERQTATPQQEEM